MIDIGKLKTLPEDVDIGKIRLSDGRWLIVEPVEVDDDGLRLPSADEEEKI